MTADSSNAYGAKPAAAEATNDVRLRTARKRLLESSGQEDAIEAVREIVANFLGCEEMGLFQLDRRSKTFEVFWSFGIDLEEYDLLRTLGDAGLQRLMRGECHVEFGVRDQAGVMAKAQAFIPIRVGDQTIAVLAILRLLPQKTEFERSDMEIFKLLSREAAKHLFGTNAHAATGAEGSGMRV
ncbi:MAG: hypothetical protein WAL52_23060 [Candidatus Sulfotelmatobacter sp.]